jgi:hypothetical protein
LILFNNMLTSTELPGLYSCPSIKNHAMNVYGSKGVELHCASLHQQTESEYWVSRRFCFTDRSLHWTGVCVGLTVFLVAVEKREMFLCWESRPGFSGHSQSLYQLRCPDSELFHMYFILYICPLRSLSG